ncbi:phosphate regulon sensor histidine kinase PhoR [Agarivorans sp. MS3-6]|uniref:phosphate regulon sensor histidine kinase PhoR n=1 Tax=Agarivorans sp. TSD2052 TaxID=2937286 RepID=UPI00200DAE49|nr:phosphate regulon sensor histidine kinase PhoR [Agarivorans sp. TSD2052]UPW19965.1 phosphate regulon sensor histidine kinase PhoR [Agarivorans sp. TSD2052]
MFVPFSWQRVVWRVALVYSPLFVLGALTGYLLEMCLLAAVSHIIWMYSQQHKLLNWLYNQRKLSPPHGSGSWEPVFHGIYNMLKRRLGRERELAQLMKYFRLGAEALPDAIVVTNQDGAILWCNQLAQSILGLKWPADAGQYLTNLVRTPKFVSYLRKGDFDQPLEIMSPVQADVWLEFRAMPYSQQQLLLVVRDVSQLRKLERMRKRFVSNVSHELRTPLTVLRGYLEMLDQDQVDPMIWGKARNTMLDQSSRMENLVNQLLTLAKIESASVEDSQESIDFSAMVSNLEADVAGLAKDKQLTFSFNIEAGVTIQGEREQLRSACGNLLGNAIKYCTEPGEITVSLSLIPQGALFKVKDSGPGIAPKHLQRLTERFYRVDRARSRDTGGAGLGLSIVKHALQHHDSQLKIKSTLDKGSTFSFVLPRKLFTNES